MQQNERAHETRIIRELESLREIALREHGPQGRSTRRLQEALKQAQRDYKRSARRERSDQTRPR